MARYALIDQAVHKERKDGHEMTVVDVGSLAEVARRAETTPGPARGGRTAEDIRVRTGYRSSQLSVSAHCHRWTLHSRGRRRT